MAAIRRFFEKRKVNAKFKLAGPGQSLTASGPAAGSSQQNAHQSRPAKPVEKAPTTESGKRAAAAALARFEQHQKVTPTMANRSLNVIRAQALKELQEERKVAAARPYGVEPQLVEKDGAPMLSVNGVFFTCSLVGPYVLPYEEMLAKVREYLNEQLEEERGLTSCLIIHTCNKNKEKVKQCVETLCKCLDNLLTSPNDEKYRKIRVGTKTFQEKIACVEGAVDFLIASGFVQQRLPYNDTEDDFYIFNGQIPDSLDYIGTLKEALTTCEPLPIQLDRNAQVLTVSQGLGSLNLPPDFYSLSYDEIKKELAVKQDIVEKNQMLRTKAMRERDELKEKRKYRYALIRVRFPDGIMLQGTFSVREKLTELITFVQEHLAFPELPFVLSSATGHHLAVDESILDLQLAPAAIVHFSWDPEVAEDIIASSGNNPIQYLNDETMCLCQSIF